MSENEQEQAAAETQTPAVPGHQGGPPPTTEAPGPDDGRDVHADSGRPEHVEPRAGRDD